MEPLRVLHVVTKMDAAGLETLIMNFYRNINRKKIQFDFLTHREENGFYDREIKELGGKIFTVPPINPFKHRRYINSLNDFFNYHKEYKIVHSHINTYSMYPLRAAKYSGVPIRIAHSHISDVSFDVKTPFRMYTKSKINAFSTTNFACSKEAGIWLFGEGEYEVINNAIDSIKYKRDIQVENKMRQELGLTNKFVIGHIGRFNKQKNHSFIIDVFYEIQKIETESVLLLIGTGELQHKIQEKVQKLNLTDKVIFAGVRKDVNKVLQAIDVFLFPSLFEGLGIVAVESQAAGVPTIVSEKIPKEAHITDLVSEMHLKDPSEKWAEEVLKFNGMKKKNAYHEVKNAGYDIIEETKRLEDFYLESYKQFKGEVNFD